MRKLRRLAVFVVLVVLCFGVVHFFVHVSSRIFSRGSQVKSEVDSFGQVHSIDLGKFNPKSYIPKITEGDKKDPYHSHGFHIVNSRNVRWDRSLTDLRSATCKEEMHSGLTPTSVIIAFHNEERSALLRTVISILRRTPPLLLQEIILIDDYSDNEDDGKLLASIPKVKLHRNVQREGAVRSRVWGAEIASGEIITFLDSHCEVNMGWLEPLLHRIKEDPLVIAVPMLDVISSSSLQLSPTESKMIGGFDWSLKFKWETMPSEDYAIRRDSDPIRTPVMYGAAFSVHKETFDRLGKYDTGMEIQGAENIEISLRAWMCGASVEMLPCSHIGHIFRKRPPYTFPDGSTSMYIRNSRRIAEAWLDEFKRFYYALRPTARLKPYGSVTERRHLRKQLNCQSFKWYLDTIYPQLRPPVMDEYAYGTIRQDGLCMDIDSGHVPVITKLNTCSDQRSSQEWSWKKNGRIISNGMCLVADVKETHGYVLVQYCSGASNQLWFRDKQKIVHQASSLCIDSHKAGIGLVLSDCDDMFATQRWTLSLDSADD